MVRLFVRSPFVSSRRENSFRKLLPICLSIFLSFKFDLSFAFLSFFFLFSACSSSVATLFLVVQVFAILSILYLCRFFFSFSVVYRPYRDLFSLALSHSFRFSFFYIGIPDTLLQPIQFHYVSLSFSILCDFQTNYMYVMLFLFILIFIFTCFFVCAIAMPSHAICRKVSMQTGEFLPLRRLLKRTMHMFEHFSVQPILMLFIFFFIFAQR